MGDKVMPKIITTIITESNEDYANRILTLRHPGEDVRVAKAIYECAHGEQLETNVKLWMDFAREAAEHFGIKGIQQTAKYLNIKTNRL